MKPITLEQADFVRKVIEDVKTRFTREIDQGLLNRDLYRAVESMAGREACDRIRAEILRRFEMLRNRIEVEEMAAAPKTLLRADGKPEKVKREA